MGDNNYQHDQKRLVEIFRSPREEGLYLYVDRQEGTARVPAELLARFGQPQSAMVLLLEPTRPLARAEATTVLAQIRDQGYYLQLPPLPDLEMFAVRTSNQKLGR
jgi:uncharacterized protein YcgL (UPF0745 family)